jgi:hypothetical protein
MITQDILVPYVMLIHATQAITVAKRVRIVAKVTKIIINIIVVKRKVIMMDIVVLERKHHHMMCVHVVDQV